MNILTKGTVEEAEHLQRAAAEARWSASHAVPLPKADVAWQHDCWLRWADKWAAQAKAINAIIGYS